MATVLVTGSAGFIGSYMAKRFLARGDEVIGLDNINDYYDMGLKYGRLAETGIKADAITYGRPDAATSANPYCLYNIGNSKPVTCRSQTLT